jgi:hypothetical protein
MNVEQGSPESECNQLVLHARVYLAADFYVMTTLKRFALKKVTQAFKGLLFPRVDPKLAVKWLWRPWITFTPIPFGLINHTMMIRYEVFC